MIERHSASMTTAILDLCAVAPADRPRCAGLLGRPAGDAVLSVLASLDARWGSFPADGIHRPEGIDEESWIAGMLRFAPAAAERLERAGIAPEVIEATLADIGSQFELHRRMHGGFGMATDWWSTLHLSGSLFRLGRLQFHLHRAAGHGPWVVGIHIPEDGPLDAAAVDASFAAAAAFLDRHFGTQRIDHAYCDSWLLDPYLATGLPDSNIARFAARFGHVALRDGAADALYFTFRAPADVDIATLPRESSLQRLVLERIESGGEWQVGKGTAPWPLPVG